MNLDYFFKNSKNNDGFEVLLEKSKYSDFFDNLSYSFVIGIISIIIMLVIYAFSMTVLLLFNHQELINFLHNFVFKIMGLSFIGGVAGNLLWRFSLSIKSKKYKEKLKEKLQYFYQESVYMPILKELNVIDDEGFENNEEYNDFLIALNNKNLNDKNILYIIEKYKKYIKLKNQDVNNELLKEMKENIANGKSTITKEENKPMIFFK